MIIIFVLFIEMLSKHGGAVSGVDPDPVGSASFWTPGSKSMIRIRIAKKSQNHGKLT